MLNEERIKALEAKVRVLETIMDNLAGGQQVSLPARSESPMHFFANGQTTILLSKAIRLLVEHLSLELVVSLEKPPVEKGDPMGYVVQCKLEKIEE